MSQYLSEVGNQPPAVNLDCSEAGFCIVTIHNLVPRVIGHPNSVAELKDFEMSVADPHRSRQSGHASLSPDEGPTMVLSYGDIRDGLGGGLNGLGENGPKRLFMW